MSIAEVEDADYATTINTIRGHIGAGTQMSAYEMRLALAVVKDSISRMGDADFSTVSDDLEAQAIVLADTKTALDAQITALGDFDTDGEVIAGTAAAAAAVAAAIVVLTTASSDLDDAATALGADVTLLAAIPPMDAAPEYVVNTVADGS